MAEFLALAVYDSNGVKFPNPYHTPFRLRHQAIGNFYLRHFQDKWQKCDTYGLRHLTEHLRQAGLFDELHQLLRSFGWLQAKLEATDVNAVIGDYECPPSEAGLRTLQTALRLSAHALTHDVRKLPGQLIGRLLGNQSREIQDFVSQAAEKKPWAWLRPLNCSLVAPGGPLIRTLLGHTNTVTGVAVTPDSRYTRYRHRLTKLFGYGNWKVDSLYSR
jgi:hypothetical protein